MKDFRFFISKEQHRLNSCLNRISEIKPLMVAEAERGITMFICDKAMKMEDLRQLAATGFGDMVKGVVDIDRELLALDAELHADLEALLLENGSLQNSLWGINLYPDEEDFVEFDSLINIRPMSGNRSTHVWQPKQRSR